MLKFNNKIPTYIEIDEKSAASISIKNHIVWRKEQPNYFYIQPLADTSFDSTNFAFIGENNVLYSLNGYRWRTFETGSTQVNINANDKLYLRAINDYERPTSAKTKIVVNTNYNIGGDLTSLIKGSYSNLFNEDLNIINAEELILPENLSSSVKFDYMFNKCSNLISAPELPATELVEGCYAFMFSDCNSLTKAPTVLPATELKPSCYDVMFYGCSSLVKAPELMFTTAAPYSCECMFQECTSLVNAPALPATTLTNHCYLYMFRNCTSLVNAPKLPATRLATRCYLGMFQGCSSLEDAPALPATTLTSYCYSYMFSGCTNLVNAPKLPATTLASSCYLYMFLNCSKLKTIYCNARYSSGTTSITTSIGTKWLNGAPNTTECTFYKNPNWTGPTSRGVNTIPSLWQIVNWVQE